MRSELGRGMEALEGFRKRAGRFLTPAEVAALGQAESVLSRECWRKFREQVERLAPAPESRPLEWYWLLTGVALWPFFRLGEVLTGTSAIGEAAINATPSQGLPAAPCVDARTFNTLAVLLLRFEGNLHRRERRAIEMALDLMRADSPAGESA